MFLAFIGVETGLDFNYVLRSAHVPFSYLNDIILNEPVVFWQVPAVPVVPDVYGYLKLAVIPVLIIIA
jgi:hypothetical protein